MKSFEQQQQELVDSFKKQLSNVFEEIMHKFYCDVTPYAETDASLNFRNMIRDEVLKAIVNEVKEEHSFYSWAHSVRMTLLKQYKEELQNKIIEDLQEKVKASEEKYFQLWSRQ